MQINSTRVQQLEQATLAAARYLLTAIEDETTISVERKPDHSLVMNLDHESQRLIIEALGREIPIVAEEDEKSHGLIDHETEYFLIDPLDGTSACKRFLTARGGQVGFGPLLGYVKDGELSAACFYNVPFRALCTAVRGGGCFVTELPHAEALSAGSRRFRQKLQKLTPLREAAALFYTSALGEVSYIQEFRARGLIENAYRFGGFANDCMRLACGYEQIQLQFAVKPWDFSAVLFPLEAGYRVLMDPVGSATDFAAWKISKQNPVLIAPPEYFQDLMKFFPGKPQREK